MGCASSVQEVPNAAPPPPSVHVDGFHRPPPIIIPGAANAPTESPRGKESAISAPERVGEENPVQHLHQNRKILQASQPALSFRPDIMEQALAPPDTENFSSGLVFTNINNNLQSSTATFNLIKKGDLPGLIRLVESAFDDDRRRIHVLKGMWNSTPLLVAIQYQQREIVEYLLQEPPSPAILNASNDKGATAVLFAALEGLADLLEQLIALGATVDLPPTKEPVYNSGTDQSLVCTPLSAAIINNHKPVVSQLLNAGCSANTLFTFPAMKSSIQRTSKGVEGLTPVLLATAFAHDDMLRDLLHRGADLTVRDSEQSTVLHHLARCSLRPSSSISITRIMDCFQAFLATGKVSYNLLQMHDMRGDSPLLIACESKHVELVRGLLEEGSSPSSPNPDTGVSPLHVAVKRKNAALVALLLEFGADPLLKAASTSAEEINTSTNASKIAKQSPLELAKSLLAEDSEIVQALQAASTAWSNVRDREARIIPSHPSSEVQVESVTSTTVEDVAVEDTSATALQPVENLLIAQLTSPTRDAVQDFSTLLDDSMGNTPVITSSAPRIDDFLAIKPLAPLLQDDDESFDASPLRLPRNAQGVIVETALMAADAEEIEDAVDALAAVALQKLPRQELVPEASIDAIAAMDVRDESATAGFLQQLQAEVEEEVRRDHEAEVMAVLDEREEAAMGSLLRQVVVDGTEESVENSAGDSTLLGAMDQLEERGIASLVQAAAAEVAPRRPEGERQGSFQRRHLLGSGSAELAGKDGNAAAAPAAVGGAKAPTAISGSGRGRPHRGGGGARTNATALRPAPTSTQPHPPDRVDRKDSQRAVRLKKQTPGGVRSIPE